MEHVVLVRHGESELNALNRTRRVYCGQIETPLTEFGRQQAQQAADRIGDLSYLQLTRAISSPLTRAAQTLELMLGRLARPIQVLPPAAALMERSHGQFEGRCEDEIFAEFPHYRDDPNYSGFMNHFEQCAPGGENLAAVSERAWPILESLSQESGDLLVVSHYNTIRCLLGRALGLDQAAVLRLRIPNAQPLVVDWRRRTLLHGADLQDAA